MSMGMKPKQFAWYVGFVVLLAVVLHFVNRGDRVLYEREFDASIVELRTPWRTLYSSFQIADIDPRSEPISIYYWPASWSTGFGHKNIEIGMIARKNPNSDTITFLDRNRRLRGFVVFKLF